MSPVPPSEGACGKDEYERGVELYRQGRFDEAAKCFAELRDRGGVAGTVARFYQGMAHRAIGVAALKQGRFDVAEGPISPDHIVYARAFPLVEEPDADAIAKFRDRHGYAPLVYATGVGVFAVGPTEARARLTLDLAEDGALLKQLAHAFGGIEFLDDRRRSFIEHWEVEAYRQKQMAG